MQVIALRIRRGRERWQVFDDNGRRVGRAYHSPEIAYQIALGHWRDSGRDPKDLAFDVFTRFGDRLDVSVSQFRRLGRHDEFVVAIVSGVGDRVAIQNAVGAVVPTGSPEAFVIVSSAAKRDRGPFEYRIWVKHIQYPSRFNRQATIKAVRDALNAALGGNYSLTGW